MGQLKQELIDKFLQEPLKIGDDIEVKGFGTQDKSQWGITGVVDIIDGVPYIRQYREKIAVTEEWRKWTGKIGTNPFPEERDRVNSINFALSSIVFKIFKDDKYDINGTPIVSVNFNPFVFINGEKKYYQRPLVWGVEEKQLLVESIYNNVDCGKILVRQRGWKELEDLQRDGHELAWLDVVDGKQRLNAIREFMDDGFPDKYGNRFSDFSKMAKHRFLEHQLFSYSELPENIDDQYVLKQFLRLNFAGIPQSQEHLDYVKSLL